MKARRSRCFYCDRVLSRASKKNGRFVSTYPTRDHIIPQSHPLCPGDMPSNIVLACARCNEARGTEPAILFLLFATACLREAPAGTVRQVRERYRLWLARRKPHSDLAISPRRESAFPSSSAPA